MKITGVEPIKIAGQTQAMAMTGLSR